MTSAAPRTTRDPDTWPRQWPVGERSLITTVLGIPPLAAVGLASGLAALGVFVDLQWVGAIGRASQVLYGTGCVLAIVWVRRRSLFAPIVQPPLLLAGAVLATVLLGDGSRSGSTLLSVGAPLVASFPTMATTSGVVLALGLFRLVAQREPRDVRPGGETAAARGEGRTRATPRRS